MLILALRRLRAQRRLVLGVLALVTTGATLLGVCTLLVTVTQDRAFAADVRGAAPEDVEATAYLVRVPNTDAPAATLDARTVVTAAFSPLGVVTTSSEVGVMRQLGGRDRLAYLAHRDDLQQQARLVSGRWPGDAGPGAPIEAVVPAGTALLLDLGVGSRVDLGREVAEGFVEAPVAVVVVGTFAPRTRAGWEQDPLDGVGSDLAYTDGSVLAEAYGPFEVVADALLASGSSLATAQVTARPALDDVTPETMVGVAGAVDGATARLTAAVGDRAWIARVASDLPRTVGTVRAQQAATRSLVLVVALLGTLLTVAALLLAGRLTTLQRADERALLVSAGAGRGQLLRATVAEATVLGLAAGALATPASAAAHAWLTSRPDPSAAGLAQAPTVTPVLVLVVLAGSLVLAAALVVPTVRVSQRRGPRGRAGLGRWSADAVLLAVAVGGWWQVRAAPRGVATSGDVVQILAPVCCVGATAVLAVRLVTPVVALLDRAVRRTRTLVVPLAVIAASRRPLSLTASVLLVAAAAAATFGLSLDATWRHSQVEQGALRVGTDLVVTTVEPASSAQAETVTAATGGVVSPAVTEPVALGSYLGDPGSPPVLVAVNARDAGAVLRGRPPAGRSWTQVGDLLTVSPPVRGIALPDGADGVEVTGRLDAASGVRTGSDDAVTVTPTLVVQDRAGVRTTVSGDPVPLDGEPHVVRWSRDVGPGQALVAVRLAPEADPGAVGGPGGTRAEVVLGVPGEPRTTDEWSATTVGDRPSPIASARTTVERTAAGTQVRATATLSLPELADRDAGLLLTAFPPPQELPVAASGQLADALDVEVGGTLAMVLDGVSIPLRITTAVPDVPSAPGRIAVLADQDALSRALISSGHLETDVDSWWVGRPGPDAAARVRAADVGDVVTRSAVTDQLLAGPLQVTVPAALLVLVVAAVLLAVVGVVLLLVADLGSRAAEVARLRALGLTRTTVRRMVVGQHVTVFVLLLLVGTLEGAAAAVVLGPGLIRSDEGLAPVPVPRARWPWPGELGLTTGLVLACVVTTVVLTAAHVRRSDAAHLRVGDP